MSTHAEANIRLKFPSQKQVATLFDALTPEANSPSTHRAKVKIEKDGLSLVLAVEAEDTIALRATLNAYLRWTHSTINVIDAVERS